MKTKHIVPRRTYLTTNGTRSLLRLAKLALMAIPTGLKMYSRRLQLSLKIYPKGPKNGRTVQMNCESVNSDF